MSIFNITRLLAERGAKIFFVAVSGNEKAELPEELSRLCESVLIVRTPYKYGFKSAVRNLFSSVPINVQKYHSGKILKKVIAFAADKKIELIHVDHLHMAYYGLALKRILEVPVVLREHNLEFKITERFAETSSNPALRLYASLQARKILEYEPSICAKMDKCIMITEQDRDQLLSLRAGIDADVIPAGVDADFFKEGSSVGETDTIGYVGSLDWLPNIDGLKWFVQEVMPIIAKSKPSVKFNIYGKNASHGIDRLDNGKNVRVKGFVEDVRTVFRESSVMIVPLFAASGIRIKILEAMAAGKAIVTTSIGCEGINCEPGKHVFIADTPGDFAENVVKILDDSALRAQIGRAAAEFVREKYSWHQIGDLFWNTYSNLIRDFNKQTGN